MLTLDRRFPHLTRHVAAGALAAAGAGYAAWVATAWRRYGRERRLVRRADDPLDRFMPQYEVTERHVVRVDAPAALTYAAARDLGFSRAPLVRAIFALRALPARLRDGAGAHAAPAGRSLVEETQALGWRVLYEEAGRILVMGAYTRPWEAEVTFHGLPADEFAAFDEPGFAKIVWTLEAAPLGPGRSRFVTRTRVATTDPVSRSRFRRYWSLLSPGILTIRRASLGMVRREAERRRREADHAAVLATQPELMDRHLPRFDATAVEWVRVAADPQVTWDSIREADLTDPVVSALFSVRELPERLRGRRPSSRERGRAVTFADLTDTDMGFTLLDEQPGREFVAGSVGRFWKRDYGWRPTPADRFDAFDEPGYAKLVAGFLVAPAPGGGSLLRYEARTVATDAAARRRFLAYWRVIRPGVHLVMRHALQRIREEAERRQA